MRMAYVDACTMVRLWHKVRCSEDGTVLEPSEPRASLGPVTHSAVTVTWCDWR